MYLPKVETIGDSAFQGCTALDTVDLPNVTNIGTHTYLSSKLVYINLPKIETIGDAAFSGIVNAPTTRVFLPEIFNNDADKNRIFSATGVNTDWDKITFIFSGKENYIPSENSYTGSFLSSTLEKAFLNVSNQTSASQFKDNVKLKSVSLPYVKNLFGNTFQNCPLIESIHFPEVVAIGNSVFTNSALLKIVDLPSVKKIENQSFSGSPIILLDIPIAENIGAGSFSTIVNLPGTHVYMDSKFDNAQDRDSIFGKNNWSQITFHFTYPFQSTYQDGANSYTGRFKDVYSEEQFMSYTDTIPEGNRFHAQNKLTSISLPNVQNMGNYAFEGCGNLVSINLPKATNIGGNAFGDSPNLKVLDLPYATDIGSNAFTSAQLTYLSIPNATLIGDNAFANIINLPETIVYLNPIYDNSTDKDRIFNSSSGSTGGWNLITFRYTSLAPDRFSPLENSFTGDFNSPAIETHFLETYSTIADTDGFNRNNKLLSVSMPLITSVGIDSFTHNIQLAKIYFPNAKEVRATAFKYSSQIKLVDLPKATFIGTETFYFCLLTYINVPIADTIGDHAFASTVNAATTIVRLPEKFNSAAEKDRIFKKIDGTGDYSTITFIWIPAPLAPWEKIKPYIPSSNTYTGLFRDHPTQIKFLAADRRAGDNEFGNNPLLESVSMPFVKTVSVGAFNGNPKLTNIHFPEATVIENGTFTGSPDIKVVSLPKVQSIGTGAFLRSEIVYLDISEATIVGDAAFPSIVNNTSTTVYMNKKFNTTLHKDRIFKKSGEPGGWDQVFFVWTNLPITPKWVTLDTTNDGYLQPYAGRKGRFSSAGVPTNWSYGTINHASSGGYGIFSPLGGVINSSNNPTELSQLSTIVVDTNLNGFTRDKIKLITITTEDMKIVIEDDTDVGTVQYLEDGIDYT